jgi:hypothetical protein
MTDGVINTKKFSFIIFKISDKAHEGQASHVRKKRCPLLGHFGNIALELKLWLSVQKISGKRKEGCCRQ